jgi:exopolyphosphatase
MTVKALDAGDFNSYLLKAKKQIKSDLFQHIVMGNESADLDSIVSASMYAYFLRHQSSRNDINIVPLINTRSSEISLRPEVIFLFANTGLDIENLAFQDCLHPEEFHMAGRLKLTLIDHNELAHAQSRLKNAVEEIIDHHVDEKQFRNIAHRVIEPVGSCATLVAEHILDAAPELLDKHLAKFLFGPILLDTVNLDPSKGRCREKDIAIASRLLKLGTFPRTKFFEQLMEKRSDLSSFDPHDLMIKDFKIWTANGFRFGISVIPIKVERWLSRNPDLLFMIREFAVTMKLDLYLIMAYQVEATFAREIIVYSSEHGVLSRTYCSFLKPILNLDPLTNIHFQSETMENFIISIQRNSDISRKILAPKLRQYFLTENSVP